MDIWKHGKYIDTWSLVHFLSGTILVSIFYLIGYQFTTALILATVLLFVWEIFEWITKIIEPSANVIMDIIFGLAGFFTGAYFYYFLEKPFEMSYFAALLLITAFLSLWGFLDFLKRGYR